LFSDNYQMTLINECMQFYLVLQAFIFYPFDHNMGQCIFFFRTTPACILSFKR